MRELSVKEAINEALFESFENDENVILMGEDIAGGKGRENYEIIGKIKYDHKDVEIIKRELNAN